MVVDAELVRDLYTKQGTCTLGAPPQIGCVARDKEVACHTRSSSPGRPNKMKAIFYWKNMGPIWFKQSPTSTLCNLLQSYRFEISMPEITAERLFKSIEVVWGEVELIWMRSEGWVHWGSDTDSNGDICSVICMFNTHNSARWVYGRFRWHFWVQCACKSSDCIRLRDSLQIPDTSFEYFCFLTKQQL